MRAVCQQDNFSYRRTCQDIYALLIWLNHQIGDDDRANLFLAEYNSPRDKSLHFVDISSTHRQVPGVRASGWWSDTLTEKDREFLQFIPLIESNYLSIKNEVLSLPDGLHSSLWGPYLDVRLSTNADWNPHTSWNSIPLYGDTQWNEKHCKLLPITCSLLKQNEMEFHRLFNRSNYLNLVGPDRLAQDYSEVPTLGIKLYKVWPNSRIKPHLGSPGRLVHSIALVTPTNPASTISVSDVTKEWVEGNFHHFDDSFVHDVVNNHPTETRIVMAFVAIHPDLLRQDSPMQSGSNLKNEL